MAFMMIALAVTVLVIFVELALANRRIDRLERRIAAAESEQE